MNGLKLAEGERVVVCDGAKALILENIGDAKFPNLKTLEVREQPDLRTREIGSDKPGRQKESSTLGRSAMEQTDWHDRSEEQFLRELVAELAMQAEHGKLKALTIVTPPRALGMMRPHYTHVLQNVIKNELAHDYVMKPVPEIERLLTK